MPGQPMGVVVAHDGPPAARRHGCVSQLHVEAADRLSGETEGHVVVTVSRGPGDDHRVRSRSRGRQPRATGRGRDRARGRRRGRAPRASSRSAGVTLAAGIVPSTCSRVSVCAGASTEDLSETCRNFEFTEYRRDGHVYASATHFDPTRTCSLSFYVGAGGTADLQLPAPCGERRVPAPDRPARQCVGTVCAGLHATVRRADSGRGSAAHRPFVPSGAPVNRLEWTVSWDGRDNPAHADARHVPQRRRGARGTRARLRGRLCEGFLPGVGLPADRCRPGTVLALRGQLGVAHGFSRSVTVVDALGESETSVVRDLPVSQRFFAGGGTTVRGFPLDRLGVFDPDCVPCSVINPTTGYRSAGTR